MENIPKNRKTILLFKYILSILVYLFWYMEKSNMKIFITGSSGFIGKSLTKSLINDNHQVIGYDKEENGTDSSYSIQGDILDYNKLNASIQNNTNLIIHLAALHKDNIKPKSLYEKVNVCGTKNIVKMAIARNINNILFLSSVAVYGEKIINHSENEKAEPSNPYGESKLAAENVLINWAKKNSNRTLNVIRPAVVIGEGHRGNVYNLIKFIARYKYFMIGQGNNHKSIVYLNNLIQLIKVQMNNEKGIHIFNYADKPDLTIDKLIKIIRSELRLSPKMIRIPYVIALNFGYFCDIIAFIRNKPLSISSLRVKKICKETTVSIDK